MHYGSKKIHTLARATTTKEEASAQKQLGDLRRRNPTTDLAMVVPGNLLRHRVRLVPADSDPGFLLGGQIADLPGLVQMTDLHTFSDLGDDLVHVPTAAALRRGDPGAIYVTTQGGLILRFDLKKGRFDPIPFADFRDQVLKMRKAGSKFRGGKFIHLPFPKGFLAMGFSDERGLLGLAFDPKSPNIYYIHLCDATDRQSVDHYVVLYRVAAGKMTPLFRVEEPQFNHDGGHLAFGPDGHLYVALGDGGGFNDEHGSRLPDGSRFGYAQDPTVFHGKILRLDVSGPGAYKIPPDNPLQTPPRNLVRYFSRPQIRREIWHLGLRNPWKFCWNPHHPAEMFVADVGQNQVEEVNLVMAGGANLGWRAMEGDRVFSGPVKDLLDRSGVCYRPPILTYTHQTGVAIIGGYVLDQLSELHQHLERILDLKGQIRPDYLYLYGDYNGKVFLGFQLVDREWRSAQIFQFKGRNIHSFAQDRQGRIYALWTTTFGKPGPKQSGISRMDVKSGTTTTTVGDYWSQGPMFNPGLPRHHGPTLSDEEMRDIVARGLRAADRKESAVRWNVDQDRAARPQVWVSVIRRADRQYYTRSSSNDAWYGSRLIAEGKAGTANDFSSNQNANSSRAIGELSRESLWGIGTTNPETGLVTFPGGLPLYRRGKLVGGVGVSGDGVDVDEAIAIAASEGYTPPPEIRIDARTQVSYTKN